MQIALGDTKIRCAIGEAALTSKLIDGTFPDYDRVIPTGNDKMLEVPCKEFAEAVDRVSTISTERSRAVRRYEIARLTAIRWIQASAGASGRHRFQAWNALTKASWVQSSASSGSPRITTRVR